MAVQVEIQRRYQEFRLQIHFSSEAKRIGVLGASGSGKSMMLKSIAGIETAERGRIVVDGRTLFDTEKRINLRTQKRNVGYLFQNYALFPTMTVRKNIEQGLYGRRGHGRRHSGGIPAAQEDPVQALIDRCGLTGLEHRLPRELSGGQQQRVALARILACDPDVILLDEPFSALDMYLKDRMQRELLQQLQAYDRTVILVSHDRDEIYRFSEDVVIIDSGRVIACGKTAQIFADPGSREAARLTGCKNISAAARVDDHTLLAKDWGIVLRTRRVLPQALQYIGYRAHEFLPVWGDRRENCIPFVQESFVQLPFERNYYIRPQKDPCRPEDVLTWLVQREQWTALQEKGTPQYLQFREDALLFLQ